MQLEDQLNDSQSNLSYLKSNLQHMEEQTTAEKKETLKYICPLNLENIFFCFYAHFSLSKYFAKFLYK